MTRVIWVLASRSGDLRIFPAYFSPPRSDTERAALKSSECRFCNSENGCLPSSPQERQPRRRRRPLILGGGGWGQIRQARFAFLSLWIRSRVRGPRETTGCRSTTKGCGDCEFSTFFPFSLRNGGADGEWTGWGAFSRASCSYIFELVIVYVS